MTITITAFDWVPDFARGQVRDLRVRWALEEIGLPYAVRYLRQGEQKGAAHRALQPFGQLPTYEDGAVTLYESGAIVLHVAGLGDGLLPADTAGRAHALEWAVAALNTVEPVVMDYAIATLFEADRPWSAARLPAVQERLRGRFAQVAARLEGREWYGPAFSAGDLLMICALRTLAGEPPLAEHPVLVDYIARGEARPAFAKALADQMAGFTGAPPPGMARETEA